MSERTAFLAAIEEAPGEDAPRWAFADWLEEHNFPRGDFDRATAEFIRIACPGTGSKLRQTNPEGKWLEANWLRLIPSAIHHRGYRKRRVGRWLHTCLRGPSIAVPSAPPGNVAEGPVHGRQILTARIHEHPSSSMHWFSYVALEFWRGFLRRVQFDGPLDMEWVLPQLAADQPLIEPITHYTPHWATAEQGGVSRLTRADMGAAFPFVDPNGVLPPQGEWNFVKDPTGDKARRAMLAAFRRYARSLSPEFAPRPAAA